MSAKLRPYPAYKDSTMPWVGNIPNHWLMTPNRAMVSRRKILVGTAYNDYRLLSLTKGGVIVRDISTARGKFSADMGTCQEVRHGDLVFCLFDVPETPRTVGLSAHDGMITGAYTVFECDDPVLARFLEAFYIAMDDRKLLSPLYSGLRKTIPASRFLRTKTPVPTPAEQAGIVRFLDYADRRIRRYIRAKERLIELLEEQKQAIIHQAVTGQIDVRTGQPYPAYKDSGVEWLGKVPEHWEVVPLKWLSRRIQNGTTPPTARPAYYENGTVPWYGPSSCGTAEEVGCPVKQLNPAAFTHGVARIINGPAILFVVIGATAGRMALMLSEGSTNQQITAYETETNLVCSRFLLRQLRLAENWLRSTASSATLPILNSNVVDRLKCAVPPLAEQNSIGRFLRSHMEVIDRSLAGASRQIALLRKYRTRLIADVVTGKLDVCEAAANLPDADPVAGWSRGDTIHTESHPHAIEHDMAKEAIS